MTPEQRVKLRNALRNNKLLPVLFAERAEEIASTWLSEKDSERREELWAEAQALENFKDFLYAEFEAQSSGDGADSD